MSNVLREIVSIQLVGDATGAIRSITTKAFYVPDLEQDLLAEGASHVQIQDKNGRRSIDSGIFPELNGEIHPATGFPIADSNNRDRTSF
jgi:hypothetical protein